MKLKLKILSFLLLSLFGLFGAETPRTIPLIWDASPSLTVSGYGIYRESAPNLVPTNLVTVSQTVTSTLTNVPAGTWYICVTAQADLESEPSNFVRAIVPYPATNFRILSVNRPRAVNFAWDNSLTSTNDLSAYILYMGANTNNLFPVSTLGLTNSVNFGSISNGDWYFAVVAKSQTNSILSDLSNIVKVSVPISPKDLRIP